MEARNEVGNEVRRKRPFAHRPRRAHWRPTSDTNTTTTTPTFTYDHCHTTSLRRGPTIQRNTPLDILSSPPPATDKFVQDNILIGLPEGNKEMAEPDTTPTNPPTGTIQDLTLARAHESSFVNADTSHYRSELLHLVWEICQPKTSQTVLSDLQHIVAFLQKEVGSLEATVLTMTGTIRALASCPPQTANPSNGN